MMLQLLKIKRNMPLLGLFFIFLLLSFKGQSQINLTVTLVTSTPSCQDDGSALVSVSGGVAPYDIYWVQYGGNSPAGSNNMDTVATGLSATGLAPGYYFLRINDATQPTAIQSYFTVWIQGPFTLQSSITPATCANADGKVVVTVVDTSADATGPYSFEWSNGENHLNLSNVKDSIDNVVAGVYSVSVTDGNGCFVNGVSGSSGTINQEGFYVYSNSPITATAAATPSNCFDGTASVIAVNGTVPYTYLWNTVPAQFGATAIGLSPNFYTCIITDAVGCTRQQWVNVPAGPNYLQATSIITNAVCNNSNGAVNLTVTGGVSPYSYVWSNAATTQDVTGLTTGSYTVLITDAQGCSLTAYKYIQNTSPITANITGTAPSCGLADGGLQAIVTGGSAPYSFIWSNAQTTANIQNLPVGYYNVQVLDVNGCWGSDYYFLDEPVACDVLITGKIFNDLNGNCVQDGGEGGLSNVLVNAAPGYHYGYSDNNGNYSIQADAGNYNLTVYTPNNWNQICPSNPAEIAVAATTPGTTYNSNHFYLEPDSVFNDVSVYVGSGPARPGFAMTWYVYVTNNGTTAVGPTLTFTHDALVTYTGSNPAVTAYNAATQTATWNVPTMTPQSSRLFYLYSLMPVNAVLGDSVHATATASLTGADVTPANNTDTYARLISGSYDPNDKAVTPKGTGFEGKITPQDTTLSYFIRFQNTGTDTAFTVIIRDTLDSDLDVSTFKFDGASHPLEYTISGEGLVTFTFNNILLADSFVNEPASHGYIRYFIDRKLDIPLGTQITNTAYIYFDFNLPIITNTTLNTLWDETVGINENEAFAFDIFPNPTKDNAVLKFNATEPIVSMSITDLRGREVYFTTSITHSNQIQLNRSEFNLSEGIYMVNLKTKNSSKTKRWVIAGK